MFSTSLSLLLLISPKEATVRGQGAKSRRQGGGGTGREWGSSGSGKRQAEGRQRSTRRRTYQRGDNEETGKWYSEEKGRWQGIVEGGSRGEGQVIREERRKSENSEGGLGVKQDSGLAAVRLCTCQGVWDGDRPNCDGNGWKAPRLTASQVWLWLRWSRVIGVALTEYLIRLHLHFYPTWVYHIFYCRSICNRYHMLWTRICFLIRLLRKMLTYYSKIWKYRCQYNPCHNLPSTVDLS